VLMTLQVNVTMKQESYVRRPSSGKVWADCRDCENATIGYEMKEDDF
jgi:hypothetical protein